MHVSRGVARPASRALRGWFALVFCLVLSLPALASASPPDESPEQVLSDLHRGLAEQLARFPSLEAIARITDPAVLRYFIAEAQHWGKEQRKGPIPPYC